MPVSEKTRLTRQARHDRRMAAAAKVVPVGDYCYTPTGRMITKDVVIGADGQLRKVKPYEVRETKPCPYLKMRGDWPRQGCGYCRLIKKGDNMKHRPARTSLLWDEVKECRLNPGDEAWEAENTFLYRPGDEEQNGGEA